MASATLACHIAPVHLICMLRCTSIFTCAVMLHAQDATSEISIIVNLSIASCTIEGQGVRLPPTGWYVPPIPVSNVSKRSPPTRVVFLHKGLEIMSQQ